MQWLKARTPEMTVLDIDSFSDEMLVSQATRLLTESTQYAIYFKVTTPNAPLGTAFKLLEEIIRETKPALILLEGTHARLSAIVQARTHLMLNTIQNSEAGEIHLAKYFGLPNPLPAG